MKARAVGIVCAILAVPVYADDVGLISARLIEQKDHTYSIVCDVTPQMIGMLGQPILPSGLTHDKPEYRRQGVVVTARYTFHGNEPLSRDAVILLPWNRLGAIVTAQWLDGQRTSALFARRPEGIPVDIRVLRPRQPTADEVFRERLRGAFARVVTGWHHWVLVAGAVLLVPMRRLVNALFAFLGGLVGALVVADLITPAIPALLTDGLLLIAALLLARTAILRRHALPIDADRATPSTPSTASSARFGSVLLALGFVCGLTHAGELARTPSVAGHTPIALTGFATATILAYAVLSIFLVAVVSLGRRRPRLQSATAVFLGSAAVAGLIQVVITSSQPIPRTAADATNLQLMPRSAQANPQRKSGAQVPRKLTDPFMMFIVVEPYEVRCEVLVSTQIIVTQLGFPLSERGVIALHEQDEFKSQVVALLEESTRLVIDGIDTTPNSRRADFLTLGMTGAITRARPVPELLDTGIVGVTFAYSTPGPPNDVSLTWHDLPAGTTSIPVTLTDPLGSSGGTITAQSPMVSWKNELGALQTPTVNAVSVTRPTWAIASAILAVMALVGVIIARRGATRLRSLMVYGCLLAAIGCYPLVRAPLAWPGIGRWALPPDQAADTVERVLLNVYRSFSFRDESDIYDHLAVSVTGEKLTEIYLDQRRALELENRGGARARVDLVEVAQIESVRAEEHDGIAVHAEWTVSGSVNHFGHTHYRRNRYVAVLHLIPVGGAWKIRDIQLIDEQRVL